MLFRKKKKANRLVQMLDSAYDNFYIGEYPITEYILNEAKKFMKENNLEHPKYNELKNKLSEIKIEYYG